MALPTAKRDVIFESVEKNRAAKWQAPRGRQMDAQLRRKQIVEAVLEIIIHQGVASVTVRRVAAAVGISSAALYRYYKNKTEMFKDVLVEYQECILASIRKAKLEGRSPLDAVRRLYFMMMALVECYAALPVLFSSDVLWFKQSRLRTLKIYNISILRSMFVEMIEKAQTHGEIRTDIRPEEIAVYFVGLIITPALIKARTADDLDTPRQRAANWDLFAKAVAAA